MALNDIERMVLRSFRDEKESPGDSETTDENIFKVVLRVVLACGKKLRGTRSHPDALEISRKADGSIVTSVDRLVEAYARETLLRAFPGFNFLGEETGGRMASESFSAAIDPVDGSWAFVSHDSTSAVSMAIFRDGEIILGIVLNPATGEVAYARNKKPTRLIQFSCFGEGDIGRDLPSAVPARPKGRLLINLQPSPGHRKYGEALKDARGEKEIKFLKSPGGSPAFSLLEAAKGHYIYIHPWESEPAAPYDLSAGIKLVENAGGRVIDFNGNRISGIGHTGLLVAGIHREYQMEVLNILKEKV